MKRSHPRPGGLADGRGPGWTQHLHLGNAEATVTASLSSTHLDSRASLLT